MAAGSTMLGDLLNGLPIRGNDWPRHYVVEGLAQDSRQVAPEDLYLAVQGHQQHGLKFLPQAVDRGASAVVWEISETYAYHPEQDFPKLKTVAVSNLREYVGTIAQRFYGAPAKAMQVAAVTGTNGKTSVTHFIAAMAARHWHDSGIIGTLGYGRYGHTQATTHTTPDALTIHRLLSEFYQAGIRQVAIEASSHGLEQSRMGGVDIDVAVFTNLGHDHLDYHGSYDAYGHAKLKLFIQLPRVAVLNLDDDFSRVIAEYLSDSPCQIIYYSAQGNEQADFYAESIKHHAKGCSWLLHANKETHTLKTQLLGTFNVSNALAALAVMHAWGVALAESCALLQDLSPVVGRMQVMAGPNDCQVVIDYAHTAEALEKVLTTCRALCTGRLYCVFGCGGDRDTNKRAEMGHVAARLADHIILTDDNPRHEDPEVIVNDICQGIAEAGDYQIIHNRQQAVAHAVHLAQCGDYIVIAGKGHEQVQIIGDEAVPLSDAELVQAAIDGFNS